MKKISSQRGFTLIEMIVALAIFTIVALVAIGALIKITDANRKSITLKTTINNLNFALESMSREMRVGGDYKIGSTIGSVNSFNQNIQNSDWVITFKSSEKSTISGQNCNFIFAYKYQNFTIQKAEQRDCNVVISDSDFQPLVSQDIIIENTIVDVVTGGTSQPKVFIWLKGYSGVREREKTQFSIQTSISQRIKRVGN